jgi:hypothetical protein
MNVRPSSSRALLPILAAALLIQLPLILNAGYFSHDELQWAYWGDVRSWAELWFAGGWDLRQFQFRPLTFTLWMALSKLLFESPWLMHASIAFLGAVNAVLIAAWMQQLGVARRTAVIAALIWLFNPYAMMTHGWVGALADVLWVMLTLITAIGVRKLMLRSTAAGTNFKIMLLAGAGTALALLCKEAALVAPAVFLACALACTERRPMLHATVGSSITVALYLIFRLSPILTGAAADDAYALTSAAPVMRWVEYLIFPAMLQTFDPSLIGTSKPGTREWLSILSIASLSIALFLRCPRLALLWIFAPLAALVPVLLLAKSFNHYAYAASIAAAVVLAIALPRLRGWPRIVLAIWLVLVSVHGLQVASKLRKMGGVQATLLSEVDQLLRAAPAQAIAVRAQFSDQEPIVLRSLSHVPGYRGISWSGRVQAIPGNGTGATHVMQANGTLTAGNEH